MEMTGAQILVEGMLREGVEKLFGYAGATICPLADVLRNTPQLDYTLVRNEQNAAHMASGYARISGKTGVCIVTSGPGATNLLTGIATAYMDSIPLVAFTGQVPSHLLGRDIFQEVDITGAASAFSKHSYLVKDALVAVISQRLVKRLCPVCKKRSKTTEEEMRLLNLSEPATVFRSTGCQFCNQTGYKGRIAIHEILYLDNALKSRITAETKGEEIRRFAVENGMVELEQSCRDLVLSGVTDLSEFMSINVE